MATTAVIDTTPGILRIGNRVIDEFRGHNYGVLSFSDVIVKSSNVGAVKIGFRLGAERLGRFVERFGFGRPISPDFPGESPGIVWSSDKWTEDALASVSMGYQVGVTPLQMVAAVERDRQRRRAHGAAHRPRGVSRQPPVRGQAEGRSAARSAPDTAATLTTIMEAVVDRRHRESRADRRLHHRGQDRHRVEADQRPLLGDREQRLVRRLRAVAETGDRDHRGHRRAACQRQQRRGRRRADLQRIAGAALRYLGVPPTINPAPPVLVTRNEPARVARPIGTTAPPVVTLVSNAGPQVMPDLRGMSARDAMRTLVKLGLSAHLTGQGVVLLQDPPPGAPFEGGETCRLQLGRPTATRTADALP